MGAIKNEIVLHLLREQPAEEVGPELNLVHLLADGETISLEQAAAIESELRPSMDSRHDPSFLPQNSAGDKQVFRFRGVEKRVWSWMREMCREALGIVAFHGILASVRGYMVEAADAVYDFVQESKESWIMPLNYRTPLEGVEELSHAQKVGD